jgi:hypothetical protein
MVIDRQFDHMGTGSKLRLDLSGALDQMANT